MFTKVVRDLHIYRPYYIVDVQCNVHKDIMYSCSTHVYLSQMVGGL